MRIDMSILGSILGQTLFQDLGLLEVGIQISRKAVRPRVLLRRQAGGAGVAGTDEGRAAD